MTSRFDHFKAIFQQPAERQQSASQREAERRQIKEDMAEGRRTAQKQAAAADPNAAYEAHCKAQALRIVQAGARARGIPVPTCLEQDRDDEEYPGDDTPVDDKDHKKSKELKSENLRDHMSEAELIFTALAELSTRQIADAMNATGMEENKHAGKKGGGIAKKARIELEDNTGKRVVSSDNYLPLKELSKK